jgi:hypothetical protein
MRVLQLVSKCHIFFLYSKDMNKTNIQRKDKTIGLGIAVVLIVAVARFSTLQPLHVDAHCTSTSSCPKYVAHDHLQTETLFDNRIIDLKVGLRG